MGVERATFSCCIFVLLLIYPNNCKYIQDGYYGPGNANDIYYGPGNANDIYYGPGNQNDIFYGTQQSTLKYDSVDRHINPSLYKPKIVESPIGFVHYQPPKHLQHPLPAPGTNIPVYHPVSSFRRNPSGPSYGHGGSFLGGYLIGRLSDRYGNYHYPKIGSDYYYTYDDYAYDGFNSYYRIHHYHEDPDWIQTRFTVLSDRVMDCNDKIKDLCVPNTNPFCLTNGTILCVTPLPLTTPCGPHTNELCVYTKVSCNGHPSCDPSQNFIDFYLPCISTLNYVNYRLPDISSHEYGTTVDFCVTAVAHPKALASPVGSVFSFIKELGKWHMNEMEDIHRWSSPGSRFIK